MAVTLVQWKTGDNGVTLDTAPTPGNTLLLWKSDRNPVFSTEPLLQTGFTNIAVVRNDTGGSFFERAGRMQYRVVQSGDTTAVAASAMGESTNRYVIMEWEGAYSGFVAASDVATATHRICGGSITPTAGTECVIVGGMTVGNDDADFDGPWPGNVTTPDADVTELDDTFSDSASPLCWVGYKQVASASGSYTVGGTTTASTTYCGVTVVLTGGAALPEPVDNIALLYDVYRIVAPGDTIEYLATLDDAFDKGIRPIRNQPGSGQFSINRHSVNATADIIAPGNLVKVRIPEIHSDHIFAFFMEKGDFTLVSSNEQGGEVITIGGDGALAYWNRATWLSTPYEIPWWPATMGTPPAGTKGAVVVKAGTYRHYNIAGGVIDGADVNGDAWTRFTTTGFSAYYDSRRTYDWPDENNKRFLAHLSTTEDPSSPDYTGFYFHPHQDGVTEYLPSYAVGNTSTVLLSDISADTPGAVLYRLFTEGANTDRPTQPIPLMTIDFTETTDSNGDPWTTTDALAGLTAELGETYLDTIVKLLSTGVIDIEMGPDLDMHAYNSLGRDLTSGTFAAGKVRFQKGVNIADELRRERDDLPVATFVQVVGTDGAIGTAELPDAASRVTREISITGDSNDPDVLEALGLAALNARLIRSDAVGFRIATGDSDADGLYLPGPEGSDNGDFWLGDIVRVHTGSGEQDFDEEDLRTFAITIGEDDGGNLEVTPEVGSVLGEAERQLYGGSDTHVSFTSRSQFTDTEVAEPAIETGMYFNVLDYGAIGDDTADDTAAFVAAGAAAMAAVGGTVYCPANSYKITSTLSFSSQVRLLGDGGEYGATTIRMATAATTALSFASGANGSVVEGIYVLGPGVGATGDGIYGAKDVHTINVRVGGFKNGLRLDNGSFYSKHIRSFFGYVPCTNAVVLESGSNNADFYGCRVQNSTYGFDIRGAQSVKVIGGSVEACSTAGIRANGGSNATGLLIDGVYFENVDGVTDILLGDSSVVTGTTIAGCTHVKSSYSGTGWAIDAPNAVGLVILGGSIDSSDAIRVNGSSTAAMVVHPYLRNAGTVTLPTGSVYIRAHTATTASAVGTASHGTSSEVAPLDHGHALGGTVGGGLSGTLPNPTVVNDGHSHTAATLPSSIAGSGDHEHIVAETFSGDGSTTVFEIANEPLDENAVAAYVAGLRVAITVSGAMNTTVTFAVAPASATDNVYIDYPAVAA